MKVAQSYTTPKFYDKKVQELNVLITALGWVQYVQPIAKTGESDEGTYPEVYYNDGSRTNIRIMPEGNSLSFFTLNGQINQDEEGVWYNVPLSLYVWADLTKVYTSKNYDYTTELIEDVVNILESNSCNDLEIITDGVFDGFTELEKDSKQNTMLPYTAFKINFTCNLTMC